MLLTSFLMVKRPVYLYSPQAPQVHQSIERIRQRTQEVYNRSAKPLPVLQLGQKVLVQDHKTKRWSHRGVLVSMGRFRDYTVDLGKGRYLNRNRRFIRPYWDPDP